jgi:hypothetical protein
MHSYDTSNNKDKLLMLNVSVLIHTKETLEGLLT